MTEGQLARRFEEDGCSLARICPDSPSIGYLVLTKQNMAQRIVKASPLSIQETFHDADERRPLKVTAFTFTQKLSQFYKSVYMNNARL